MPFSSAQFSRSVVSDSLRPHESQHATAIESVMPSSHLILGRPLLLRPQYMPLGTADNLGYKDSKLSDFT